MTGVTLLNPYNPRSFKKDKLSILDIKAETIGGRIEQCDPSFACSQPHGRFFSSERPVSSPRSECSQQTSSRATIEPMVTIILTSATQTQFRDSTLWWILCMVNLGFGERQKGAPQTMSVLELIMKLFRRRSTVTYPSLWIFMLRGVDHAKLWPLSSKRPLKSLRGV